MYILLPSSKLTYGTSTMFRSSSREKVSSFHLYANAVQDAYHSGLRYTVYIYVCKSHILIYIYNYIYICECPPDFHKILVGSTAIFSWISRMPLQSGAGRLRSGDLWGGGEALAELLSSRGNENGRGNDGFIGRKWWFTLSKRFTVCDLGNHHDCLLGKWTSTYKWMINGW